MPPDPVILETLLKNASAFVLLAFVVWAIVGLIRTLVEHLTKMAEQLVSTNATLAETLRESEKDRIELRRATAEQTLLIKMTLDKVSEHMHG